MKRQLVSALIILFVVIGCKKEKTTILTSLPPSVNTPPKLKAGPDIVTTSSFDTLNGSAFDAEKNIVTTLWKKISGPLPYIIENPNSLITRIEALEKGTYEFELTVIDKLGLNSKDTVTVNVWDLPLQTHGEIILKDFQWDCPLGCAISLRCCNYIVPAGIPFKVYIKRDNSIVWIEVTRDNYPFNTRYTYESNNTILVIYSNSSIDEDKSEKWYVKIIY